MEPVLAFLLFPLTLAGVLASAHYFLKSATTLGLSVGASPFVIGLFIVALGTSLPELAISISSVINGVLDVPVAQTVGSNITNILLVVGIVAILTRKIQIEKNLIDVELPLLAAITALFVFAVFDGSVTRLEGIFLVIGLIGYLCYVFLSKDNRSYPLSPAERIKTLTRIPKSILLFFAASIGIAFFSVYTVGSLEIIASTLAVPEGIIAVTALALGTSLPELAVSIRAALTKEVELIIGNIIGSNIFNILLIVGIPALLKSLTVDVQTLMVGVPMLIIATTLFIVSGISNRVHIWEGLFFVLLYMLFIFKVVAIL